jgi:PatG C-terminal
MEQNAITTQSLEQGGVTPMPSSAPSAGESVLFPQAETEGCSTCGAQAERSSEAPTYIYALGKIEPRFPSLALEKEFMQASGRASTAGLTDAQSLQAVLSQRQNRYLLRSLCWVLTIEGLETYILAPRDAAEFDLLLESLRPNPSPMDIDAVIGIQGPLAPPSMCNGLTIPLVLLEQLYSFDRDSLVKAIPKPKELSAKDFTAAAEEVLARIMQLADNAGATNEHRALNYLALRYPAIYATATECHARDCSLSGVDVRQSRLSGTRNIVDVIFSYTNRNTAVTEKYFVRVDVTEKFPFLVTKMSPYYDR